MRECRARIHVCVKRTVGVGHTCENARRSYRPIDLSSAQRPSRIVVLSGVPSLRLSVSQPARRPCGMTTCRWVKVGTAAIMVSRSQTQNSCLRVFNDGKLGNKCGWLGNLASLMRRYHCSTIDAVIDTSLANSGGVCKWYTPACEVGRS